MKVNAKLVAAAQVHARNMGSLGRMEHELQGVAQPTLQSRAAYVGYAGSWLGENLGMGYTDAASLVRGWVQSAAHRSTLLSPNLTEAGVGVARDAEGRLYFCQTFGKP